MVAGRIRSFDTWGSRVTSPRAYRRSRQEFHGQNFSDVRRSARGKKSVAGARNFPRRRVLFFLWNTDLGGVGGICRGAPEGRGRVNAPSLRGASLSLTFHHI